VADEPRHVDLAVVQLAPRLSPAHADSQLGKPRGRRRYLDESRRIRKLSDSRAEQFVIEMLTSIIVRADATHIALHDRSISWVRRDACVD
jgi:hypothetical protein